MISIDEPLSHPSMPEWVSKHTRPMSNLVLRADPRYDAVKHATIFVAIAAYRDPECRNTVLQIFEHATHPDRLRLGIFTQNDINVDEDCADFRDVLNCDTLRPQQYDFMFAADADADADADLAAKNLTADELKKARRRRKQNTWQQRYRSEPHVLCGRLHQIKTERVHWRDGLGTLILIL